MDNGEKKASKVLTTNDIREGARNWTLAGDVGLLAHLEQFSENIFSRTQETRQHFTDLVDDYEELYTKVGNVTNQFLALQNCQFVENRVYDEETPTEEKAEVKVQNEVEQEKLLLMQYKEAVEVGIKLLDTHFQEVQLPPNSDSDDDDDDDDDEGDVDDDDGDDGDEVSTGNSVIWKPKNPYAGKKFPLLIGSAEWWADDLVGLGAEEDILDAEKIISESEGDMESLKSIDKEVKSSSSSLEQIESIPAKPTFLDSSSEDLFGLDKSENLKRSVSEDHFFQRNSLPNQPNSFLPDFEKEPETETGKKRDSSGDVQPVDEIQETPASQPKKVDNAFTQELMAKRSSVTNKKEVRITEEKKGTEGRLTPAKAKPDGNLFDETDDSSDLFSAKVNRNPENPVEKKGLLFDGENDDELFKGESGLFSGSKLLPESNGLKKPEGQPVGGNILDASKEPKKPSKMESVLAKKSVMRDLFDDFDDDDILFAAAKPESTKYGYKSLPSEGNSAVKKAKSDVATGSAGDSDSGLFDSINSEMQDDFFSSSGLFATNKNQATNSKASAESSRKNTHLDLFPEESQGERKTESHFEDFSKKGTSVPNSPAVDVKKPTEDSFSFSPFSEPRGKKTSILEYEDDGDGDDDDDDDDGDDGDGDYLFSKGAREKKPALKAPAFPDDEDTALFVEKPKPPDSVSVSSSRSSLFDDMGASKSRLASVFEKDKSGNKTEDDLFSLPEDSLFGEDAKTGKDLFSSKVREKEKRSLFDDCDDGDDLFGAGKGSGGEKWSENLLKGTGDALEEAKKQGGRKAKVEAFVDDLGDDDLFKTSAVSTTLRETKSEIIMQSEARLFADDLDDSELFSTKLKAVAKPKPPDSLSLKATENEAKGSTVGKLNIPDNLKVRFELATKRISPGAVRPSLEEKEQKDEDKKDEVLDEAPRSSNLLKCPSKDRVKIPGRRRPQSRRARQEAIRNSGVWDQPNSPNNSVNTPHPSRDSLPSPVVSNPLSPSTDEEDFFKVPELDTNFEKEDQSIFKSDLFESSKSSKLDESLLFDGAPVLSPLSSRRAEELAKKPGADVLLASEKPKPESIFDDDNDLSDHDNLFKTVKPLSGQFPAKSEEKVKKMLFEQDSESDEDDLFGGRSEAAPPKPAPVGKPKEQSEGKGRGSSTFVDPLGLITKD